MELLLLIFAGWLIMAITCKLEIIVNVLIYLLFVWIGFLLDNLLRDWLQQVIMVEAKHRLHETRLYNYITFIMALFY